MPQIIIKGIPIQFPFEPYDVQKDYMEKVIECLQMTQNGALESPTGTGKTLCLLCATLGWLEHHKAQLQADQTAPNLNFEFGSSDSQLTSTSGGFGLLRMAPKIIYASRTHSQLSQAIAELKRTAYKYMKVTVLGSRDQLCIHPEVSQEPSNSVKLHMCQIRVKSKTCYFQSQVEGKKDDPFLKTEVLDIEDLVSYGKRRTCCPYYLTRELRQDADVIFMPYNYLLDPRTRKAHNIELQSSIVILDEAHNVEKICEESASLQLRSTDIAMCIDEVTQVMRKLQESGGDTEACAANDPGAEAPMDFTLEDLYLLKALFLKFELVMDALPVSKEATSQPGSYMFEVLEEAEITPPKKAIICDLLDKLVMYLTNNSSSPFNRKGAGLQKFADFIKTVFSKDDSSLAHMQAIKKSYRVHVAIEEANKKRQGGWGNRAKEANQSNALTSKQGKVLSYWCFNPGFAMKELMEQGLRCVIITSGTLSPLQSFTQELQVGFPVQLENPHIIRSHQVFVGVINKGPDGCMLNSSYENRSKPEYINSMGKLLLNYSRIVPGGLLIFFPSYPLLRNAHEHWQNSGVWDKITAIKPAFIEPQNKDGFLSTMNEFYERVNDPALRGAIFMAVCRGKVSEGLDFADCNGRAVIVTGLPYPPYKDPRIVLKQQYLNQMKDKGLSGHAWYKLEASRAVNQAIGRVIRHKDDFGAILLADHRFGALGFSSQLSQWVRPHLKKYEDFAPSMRDLTRFFRAASELCPKPKTKLSYNNKEATNGSAGKFAYNPPPLAPVGSSALCQGPSRLIPKQYGEFKRDPDVVNTMNPTSLPPKAFGGPRVTTTASSKEQPGTNAPKSVFDVLQDTNANNKPTGLGEASVKRFRPEHSASNILDFNSINAKNPETSSTSSRYENLFCVTKKRKLKVTANVSTEENSVSSKAPVTADSSAKSEKGAKIVQYVGEVKKSLPEASYKEFSLTIRRYQASNDYAALSSVFFRLFSEPDKHHLLRKFTAFIDQRHREDFKARCARLS